MTSRISKLVPLLGSDRMGEVAAAAHAIGRYLREQGRDWHDIAKLLDLHFTAPTKHIPGRYPWQILAAEIFAENPDAFTDCEVQFLKSMMRWRTAPSKAQAAWLNDLRQNLQRAA